MAIELETYEKIRYLKEQERLSQREIAQQLGISRNTVKRYSNGENVPWVRKDGSGRNKSIITNEIEEFIQKCLEEDETENLKKQKHTAKRIYERLVDEYGFTGGESTVRTVVAKLKNKPKPVFVPLYYAPAEAIQVDWGEATIYQKGVKTKVNIWCMRECYSSKPFVKAFFRQNEESFLEGMRDGFEYFGGVPQKVIFDNARIAVKEGFGYHAKSTDKYKAMSGHYAFTPVFCNPAQGHEKGLVEGLVGYSRRNFMVPVPKVDSIEQLNAMLLEGCVKYSAHQIKGKPENVGKMASDCNFNWISLPPYRFDTARKIIAKVNEFSLVSFDHNKYSVPYTYSGRNVTVKGSGNNIEIIFENKIIAQYPRIYEHNKTEYRLEHYIDLIERRPRSVLNAEPVRKTVPDEVMNFADKLSAPKEVIKLLRLYLEYGEEITCLSQKVSSLEQLEAAIIPVSKPLKIKSKIKVNAVCLSQYDKLLKEGVAV